jgi:hypothetical protein
VVSRANLSIHDGLLSGSGETEYAPNVKVAHLADVTVQGMNIDYIHTAETAAAEKERAALVEKAAEKVGKSEMLVRMDRLRLNRCTVGLVNKAADHPYRVFVTDAALNLTNLSNRPSQGEAEAELQGNFMGSGPTRVTARFRPERDGTDIDLSIKIEKTLMKEMNDLFRAYGNFDVTAGTFSFYSELHVRNDKVSGYVKPLFKDMKVYDRRKDKEKNAFHRMYEMLVGGVAKLLENRPRNEVATKTKITGTRENPHISTWQIIGELVRNAFFKAILPGFEREASKPQGR